MKIRIKVKMKMSSMVFFYLGLFLNNGM